MSYKFLEDFTRTYRAKRNIKDKHWHEGYYVCHNTRQLCPIGDILKDDDFKHLLIRNSFADWNMPRDLESIEIDVNTLCRHTGYFDENGAYFENDYVKFIFKNKSEEHIGVIKFGEYANPFESFSCIKHFGFYIEWISGKNIKTLRKDLTGIFNDGLIEHTKKNIIDNPEYKTDALKYESGVRK